MRRTTNLLSLATMATTAAVVAAAAVAPTATLADESSHRYADGEEVVLWLNKIGPYHNPQETYTYYSLPFCRPPGDERVSSGGLSQVLEGNYLVDSGMRINFKRDTRGVVPLCSKALSKDDVEMFRYAVSQHYWYQCFLDELPIWGMVGEIEGSEEELLAMEARGETEHEIRDAYVYTLKRVSIAYNGDRIIEVNLTSDKPVLAKEGVKLDFAYEVTWIPTESSFQDRFNRYLDSSFFEHHIHVFSIVNAFMMVIFLCGLVLLILLRVISNDYARLARLGEDLEGGGGSGLAVGGGDLDSGGGGGGVSVSAAAAALGDETGWKMVHGDVFRTPPQLVMLAACVGSGMQLVVLAFAVIGLSLAGSLYVDRGAMITATLLAYAFTSLIAGYVSGNVYQRYDQSSPAPAKSRGWMRTMLLTAMLVPGAATVIAAKLNLLSLYYSTLSMVPVSTFFAVLAIFLFIALPLVVIGTLLGRHASPEADFPCRVNSLPRPIPERTLFTHPLVIVLLTGVLPFGAVFIEIFFIFSSVWSHRYYYVFHFLLLVMVILVVVTLSVTVIAVYFLLNSEDWRWPWTSFLAASSTALYVFLYGVFFFITKTNMSGVVQTAFFFAYLALFCLVLALMCGALGFLGAFAFVRRIFSNLKVD